VGWIDGQKGKLDEGWCSASRHARPRPVRRSTREGGGSHRRRLHGAAVLAEVERAKRTGRWAALRGAASSAASPPRSPACRALAFFETLDGANRYAILYRIQTAKKPETRAERITRFVAMCARRETIHAKRRTTGPRSATTQKSSAKK
jgi:hypothetical protein